MRVTQQDGVLYVHAEDVPRYKKQGSIVRNNYFQALRSIADRAGFDATWEFHESVWIALTRMLTTFAESGYLGYRETMLEFPSDAMIPEVLKPMGTWQAEEDDDPIAGDSLTQCMGKKEP